MTSMRAVEPRRLAHVLCVLVLVYSKTSVDLGIVRLTDYHYFIGYATTHQCPLRYEILLQHKCRGEIVFSLGMG